MQTIFAFELYQLAGIIGRHRQWHLREQARGSMHPCVFDALKHGAPRDWHLLVLEWPRVSKTDVFKIAYTRSEEHGLADRQLILAIGKYIKRHWPHLRDDIIRDIALAYEGRIKGVIKFLPDDTEQYVRAVQQGPQSCMKWDEYSACPEDHPYWAYAAELGWRMAVRYNTHGQICGRAMVYEPHKAFVRSFKAQDDDPSSSGYSRSDGKLEAWLKARGYEHHSYWPYDTRLKLIPSDNECGFLAPYIDGDWQCVDVYSSRGILEIVEHGEFTCTSTDGDAERSDGESCYHCGGNHDSDDGRYLENYGYWVCDAHLDHYYTWIDSTDQYVKDSDVVRAVDGEPLDGHNIPDSYVLLDCGQYAGRHAREDYVVYDVDGNAWHVEDVDDGALVRLDERSRHADEYMDKDDAIEVEDEFGDTRYFHSRDIGSEVFMCTHGDKEGDYVLEDECYRNKRLSCVWDAGALATTPEDLDNGDPEEMCVLLCDSSNEPDTYYPAELATYVPEVGWFKDDELEQHTINRDAEPVTTASVTSI